MQQFDRPKATKNGKAVKNGIGKALDSLEDELEEDDSELSKDNEVMEVDNNVELEGADEPELNGAIASDKEDDELVEEGQAEMTENEVKDLEVAVKPIKLILVKVCW